MRIKKTWLLGLLISAVIIVQGWSLLHKSSKAIEQDTTFQEKTLEQDSPVEVIPQPCFEETVMVKAVLEELELELLGTALGNIKDPIAFIKDLKTSKQGVYRLGNLIQDAQIVKIDMGEVVFEREGQLEILRLSSRGRAWCKIKQESLPILSISGNQIVVSKSGALKKAADIYKTLHKIKVKPHYQSDEVVGLMVDGIDQGSIIEQAGIRNKDIINTVNNQKIDSYQKALQVFNKARNQEEITVSLLRDGQKKLLCYRIDE